MIRGEKIASPPAATRAAWPDAYGPYDQPLTDLVPLRYHVPFRAMTAEEVRAWMEGNTEAPTAAGTTTGESSVPLLHEAVLAGAEARPQASTPLHVHDRKLRGAPMSRAVPPAVDNAVGGSVRQPVEVHR